MDKLLDCAEYYKEELEGRRFLMVVAKKGKVFPLEIVFTRNEFKHLVGLHKLEDIKICKMASSQLFYQILDKKITNKDIEKSSYYSKIEERLDNFKKIGGLLFSSDEVLKSSHGSFGKGRGIKADYLLSKNDDGKYLHLFLIETGEIVLPATFFKQGTEYYLENGGKPVTLISIDEIDKSADLIKSSKLAELKAQLTMTVGVEKMKELIDETLHKNINNTTQAQIKKETSINDDKEKD